MTLRPNTTRRAGTGLTLVLAAAMACMTGCDGDQDKAEGTAVAASNEALPAPARADGSVTGMPGRPGPGQVGPPQPPVSEVPTETAIDSEGNFVDGDNLPPLPGTTPAMPADPARPDDGPGPDEAVAVVRAYYEAINADSFGRAYALWSDGGNASGQSPQQFADGFDDTAEVAVEFMAPGRIDAAAGSRHVEVPVALRATRDDGSIRHYVGTYTLRRAVVDGASAEQRAWRIVAADIREVQP